MLYMFGRRRLVVFLEHRALSHLELFEQVTCLND